MLTASASRSTPFDAAAFERFLSTRNEPGWVTDLRRGAFETYRELLATELDAEEWKRIDLRAFRADKFSIPSAVQPDAEFATLLADRTKFSGVVSHGDGPCTHSNL